MSTNSDQSLPLANVIASYREDMAPIDWQVVPTAGDFGSGVDFVAGVMAVPLGGDSHSRYTLLRNEITLRVAPPDPTIFKSLAQQYKVQGITESILRSAESARISAITEQFAARKGLQREPDGSEKVTGKRLAQANTTQAWDEAVAYTLRNYGTKSFDSFASGIRSVSPEWSKRLRQLNKKLGGVLNSPALRLGDTTPCTFGNGVQGPTGFQNTLYAASVVRDYLSDSYMAPEDIKLKARDEEDKIAQDYGKRKPTPVNTEGSLSNEEIQMEGELPDHFEFDDDSGFGKLIIDDSKPLSVEVPGYMHRKRKAMTSGRRVVYPSRMLTDPQRRVFSGKVKVKGGVVVIDISGSMNLTQQDIEDIVEAAPAAVILAYSDCSGINGDEAPNAWLLANRGWRVRDIGHIGGMNNGVDGTALTWAIRHRKRNEPLVWVTDGQVTSMSGSGSSNSELAKQCAKLVKKHRIIMIPSVDEAVAQFKSGRLINKPRGYVRSALLGRI